jgi:hypothetical protein
MRYKIPKTRAKEASENKQRTYSKRRLSQGHFLGRKEFTTLTENEKEIMAVCI